MDIIQIFAQFGVPSLVLGFILFFILKPVVTSYTRFIDQHTAILHHLNEKLEKSVENTNEIKADVKSMMQDINELKYKRA